MKVKTFSAANTPALQKSVSEWLEEGKGHLLIKHVVQSESGDFDKDQFYINLTVFYVDNS